MPGTRSLSDGVINELAKDVDPRNVTPLGIGLGFTNARIEQFRHDHLRNIHQAIVNMLCNWRDDMPQTCNEITIIEELCKVLEKADCRPLAEKLRNGEFKTKLGNKCGMVSTSSARKRKGIEGALKDINKKDNVSGQDEPDVKKKLSSSGSSYINEPTAKGNGLPKPKAVKPTTTTTSTPKGKSTKGWGRRIRIRNIRPGIKAMWHMHAKITSVYEPSKTKIDSWYLKMVLCDGEDNIDVFGFYKNRTECFHEYNKLQVNSWYKIRNVKKVQERSTIFSRQTDHKYEVKIQPGTMIVQAKAAEIVS
ncbi:uncharacterized protein [Amphiura filiformis]|uniref:uncharacterized protein n=1 Tax=Amphiura filiformis TaxID=82378 RepID=UPI003B2175C3